MVGLMKGHSIARGSGEGSIRTFDVRHLAELSRVDEEAWRRFERSSPRGALDRVREWERDGVLDRLRTTGPSKNVWTDGFITALLGDLKDGTALRITHLELGSSNAARSRTHTALVAPHAPRKQITDAFVDSIEYLKTSTFIPSSDFASQNIREGALWTAVSGGTMVNTLLWTNPLVPKGVNESAIADLNLRLVPV